MFDLFSHYLDIDGEVMDVITFRKSNNFRLFSLATAELQKVNLALLTELEKLSFFLNIYNVLVIHGTASLGPPSNKFQRDSFFTTVAYNIGDLSYTLDEMEHGLLRGNRVPPGGFFPLFNNNSPKINHIISLDPRIHFCLNCGAMSCPKIQVYRPEGLAAQLTYSTKTYLDQNIEINNTQITLTPIFNWYKHDFGATSEEVLRWAVKFVEEPKKSQLEELLDTKKYTIKYAKYDWTSVYKM